VTPLCAEWRTRDGELGKDADEGIRKVLETTDMERVRIFGDVTQNDAIECHLGRVLRRGSMF